MLAIKFHSATQAGHHQRQDFVVGGRDKGKDNYKSNDDRLCCESEGSVELLLSVEIGKEAEHEKHVCLNAFLVPKALLKANDLIP